MDEDYVRSGETYGPINSPIYLKNGRKYIKVASGRGTRYLLLVNPNNVNEENCTEIMEKQWDQLVNHTKIPTMAERKAAAEAYIKIKNDKQVEIDKRVNEMKEAQKLAEKSRKMNIIEQENEYLKKYTIDRANQLLLDQDDSMQEFNKMIALKKCIATWDQQILEKEKIKTEMKEKNLKLEDEAEINRRKRVKDDELQREKEKEERLNFINTLGEQIKEREMIEKYHQEVIKLERDRFNKAAIQSEIDELEAFNQKIKRDAKTRDEQRKVNILLLRLKAIDKEEERVFHEKQLKAQEEIQKEIDKIENEKREQERKKQEELNKISGDKIEEQKKAKFKDLMEEMLRRDNIERTWRKKELFEEQEKKKALDAMFAQLEQQVTAQRLAKAKVIEDERREVCKIAKDNIEDEEKDRAVERKIKQANETQRLEILMQINEMDRRKLINKESRQLESNYYKILQERRIDRLKNSMWRKADKVKQDGLPERYVKDIESFIHESYGPRTVKHDAADTKEKQPGNDH